MHKWLKNISGSHKVNTKISFSLFTVAVGFLFPPFVPRLLYFNNHNSTLRLMVKTTQWVKLTANSHNSIWCGRNERRSRSCSMCVSTMQLYLRQHTTRTPEKSALTESHRNDFLKCFTCWRFGRRSLQFLFVFALLVFVFFHLVFEIILWFCPDICCVHKNHMHSKCVQFCNCEVKNRERARRESDRVRARRKKNNKAVELNALNKCSHKVANAKVSISSHVCPNNVRLCACIQMTLFSNEMNFNHVVLLDWVSFLLNFLLFFFFVLRFYVSVARIYCDIEKC